MKSLPYVSPGNMKMSCPTFSLPARQTCPGCTAMCAAKCYARKAEQAYPTVLPCRKDNFQQTKAGRFVSLMIPIVEKKAAGVGLFRIHESGDFYSQAYLGKWFEICRALPHIRFLAFTKSFHLDFADKPDNLQIVASVWPDTDMDKVPKDWPRAYAGDCKLPANTVECHGNCDQCGVCWYFDQNKKVFQAVHFAIH